MRLDSLIVSHLEGTNAYCSEESAAIIREMARKMPLDSVHFIGNGNYHYLSYFFLERIDRPFSLVLFDHHPDDQCGAFDHDILSCGNWIKMARERLPLLRKVYWYGSPEDCDAPDNEYPLYISVDLDVLDKKYIETIWDQGEMSPSEMADILTPILNEKEVLGMDICGTETADENLVQKLYELVSMSKPFSQGVM